MTMHQRTLLCQGRNLWQLKTQLWSPTLLTRLIWPLVTVLVAEKALQNKLKTNKILFQVILICN
jgi:hypothetical protein